MKPVFCKNCKHYLKQYDRCSKNAKKIKKITPVKIETHVVDEESCLRKNAGNQCPDYSFSLFKWLK